MARHLLLIVSSALSVLRRVGITLVTIWLGITMAMAIAIHASTTSLERDKS